MTKAVFQHAGCQVCVHAEQWLAVALDATRFAVEVIHLVPSKGRLAESEAAGVRSVPTLVTGGQAFHIDHGADL